MNTNISIAITLKHLVITLAFATYAILGIWTMFLRAPQPKVIAELQAYELI